uniref:Uncharacterized protein n=1 Tax=Alexandrium catenella TaxID=2925 RepID=A0A7S1PPG1_ALECA
MPAPVCLTLCALLLTGASAGRGRSTAPSFSDEAAEVGNMMEAVRQRTEGGTPSATRKLAAPAAAATAERFPDLDSELLGRADEIGRQLEQSEAAAGSAHSAKRAALAAETSEPSKNRAARFFAVHGMSEVGRLLGDELSPTEAAKALRTAAGMEQALEGAAGPKASLVRRAAAAAPAAPAAADIDDWLAEDSKSEKQRWGAVDSLRRHARPM